MRTRAGADGALGMQRQCDPTVVTIVAVVTVFRSNTGDSKVLLHAASAEGALPSPSKKAEEGCGARAAGEGGGGGRMCA